VFGEARELEWHSWHVKVACEPIMHCPYGTAGAMVWMVNSLGDREYRRDWHLMLFQVSDDTGHIWECLQPILNNFHYFRAPLEPGRVRTEIGIGDKVWAAHCLTEVFPVVQERHDD